MTWPTAPLWSLASANDEVLPEAIDPCVEFDYIDIGNVSLRGGIEGSERMTFDRAPSRARRRLRDGDVLISTVRTYLRAIARVPPEHGGSIASTGFAVLRARSNVDSRFLAHAVLDPTFVDSVVAHSVGVSYPAISTAKVLRFHVPSPPLHIQAGIADFLDREVERIGTAIRTGTNSESALTNLERDIADRLVLGLPTLPLKAVATIHSGVTLNEVKAPRDAVSVPYLRVANVKAGWLDLGEVKEVPVAAYDVDRYTLRRGDLLLTEGGDLDKLGRGALWDGSITPCVFQNHIFAVRPRDELIDPSFLSWATRSSAARAYFEATASRITNIASTNRSKLGRWPVPNTGLEEQRRRLRRAQDEWRRAQLARTAAVGLVERLHAYRDALVHEVVTGELDVSQVSEQQMDERLHTAGEERADEVAV